MTITMNPERIRLCISRLLGGLIIICMLSCTAHSDSGEKRYTEPLNVGYHVIDLKYEKDGQERTLTLAVWYPTAKQPQQYNYGGPTSGNIAVDAEPLEKGGPYPLLVFSHGYGGGGLSAVFLTEALAARGWIVACPDHHDAESAIRIRTAQENNFDRHALLKHAEEITESGPADRPKYSYRLDELKRAIDGMLSSALFGKLIDKDRIAVGGHSFGGFTALGLSGTIKERLDPRIKAVLLFSTGAGSYLFTDDELASVRIPSMLFMGEREKNQKRGSGRMAELSERLFDKVSPPKYFLVVKGANHFSFNNRFSNGIGARLMSGNEAQFDVIRRYSIAFLEKYVAGMKDTDDVLGRGDRMLIRYIFRPAQDSR
jgi:predicted dienelactone hydrolase